MELFKEFLQSIPLLYRYILREFIKFFVITLLGLVIAASLTESILFFNTAKYFTWKLLFEELVGLSGIGIGFTFPAITFASLAFTLFFLLRRRINWLIFSMALSPKNFLGFILTLSATLSAFLLFYFEFVYPLAAYKKYEAYLIAKRKPFDTGIVQDFWYKISGREFLNFALVNLQINRAFGGRLIKLNNDFQISSVTVIPNARFVVKNNEILVKAKNLKVFSFDKVRKLEFLRLRFPYNPKLLRVKKPEFFTLGELVNLILYAKEFGLNYYPYLWELIGRILLVLTTFVFGIVSFIKLLGSVNISSFVLRSIRLSLTLLLFYVYFFTWESLVNKVSLNPLWSLAIIVPLYGFWLYRTIKKGT